MKFSPIKCWGSVSRSRPPLDQARWGLKDQVQVLAGWCLTFHGKIPIDAGGMMPLGGYPHDLGTPQMMNRVSLSLSLKSRLRQLYNTLISHVIAIPIRNGTAVPPHDKPWLDRLLGWHYWCLPWNRTELLENCFPGMTLVWTRSWVPKSKWPQCRLEFWGPK